MSMTTGSMPVAQGDVAMLEDDRRVSCRLPVQLKTHLMNLDGSPVLEITTDDLSEGGLFAHVPVGYGLAVGQRYEIMFERDLDTQLLSHLAGETRFATVLRTEMRTEDADVGVGLRFDQPLLF